MNDKFLEAALAYAQLGYRVFPCEERGKAPLTKNGFKDATVDPDQIQKWWSWRPSANVAVATGKVSGVSVVDIDVDTTKGRDGWGTIARLKEAGNAIPKTVMQGTPRGGAHLFFSTDNHPGCKINFQPAIDIRGNGGYVLVAPSIGPNGKPYEWAPGLSPWDAKPAEYPEFLRPEKREPATVAAPVKPVPPPLEGDTFDRARKYLAECEPAVQGSGGHNKLLWAATALVHGFLLPVDDAYALLVEEYNQRCNPPWNLADPREAKDFRRKVDEAAKLTPSKPRGWLLQDDSPAGSYTRKDVDALITNSTQTEKAGTNGAWPEIVSFDTETLPEFPTPVLPGVLRDWVEAESHATQTPPDLAGLLALTVCSATIARRVEVEPRTGWREPTNLYTVTQLEPGNRKSAVFADATRPLREVEAELIEAEKPTWARAQSDRRRSEARLKKLEKLVAEKGDMEAAHEADTLATELAAQPVPALPRLLIDDATPEKIEIMLAEQGGRIASAAAEGSPIDIICGCYSKNGAAQFNVYLKGHSGDDLVTDRVGRESVCVDRPALTCAYTVQPEVIRKLTDNSEFRGRGLLARFLYAAPRSRVGQRKIDPASMPESIREAYRATVRVLAGLKGEHVLRLSTEAATAFRKWEAEIESMLDDGGRMEAMKDWGGKLAGATLRLAAVLHCVEHCQSPDTPIAGQTIGAAIEIARYLIPHAETMLSALRAKEGATEADARYVLSWVERHGRREFTKRDAQQHGKRRFPKADDIDPALAELVRRGYLRPMQPQAEGPGRPVSPRFEVNPSFFQSLGNCTQYSQKSVEA